MKNYKVKVMFCFLFAVFTINGTSSEPTGEPTNLKIHLNVSEAINNESGLHHSVYRFHNDSIHNFDFRYPDKRRGIRPYIIPAFLITTGTAFHFMTDFKEEIRDFSQEHWPYSGRADDFIQYAPLAAVYALNAAGVKGENNFGNRSAIAVKTILLWNFMVSNLKKYTEVTRPSGGIHSFPSGHTSFAFAMAHFMNKEFGDRSKWYSVAAYTAATSVGFMRVTRNAHWVSDVVAGAGFGMLSTELIYLTHQYKWDNKHLKNFDIFPFRSKQQKGIVLVYKF